MDNGDNVQTDDMENTPDSKEQGVSANNQIEKKGGNEEESVQLSHREAMAIWKEGLAEMIEVCVVSDSVGGGNVSDQFLMGWGLHSPLKSWIRQCLLCTCSIGMITETVYFLPIDIPYCRRKTHNTLDNHILASKQICCSRYF